VFFKSKYPAIWQNKEKEINPHAIFNDERENIRSKN
jgi:hypothetical protein